MSSRRKRKEHSRDPHGGPAASEPTAAPPVQPAAATAPSPAQGPGTPSTPVTMEALAAQAQALEGVRRLHIDLADRLAAGEALRSRVDRVSDGLEGLRSEQADLRRTVERPRGRRVALLMLVLVGGMVGGVWAWERLTEHVPWVKEWRRGGGQATEARGDGLTHIASLVPGDTWAEDGLPVAEARPAGVRADETWTAGDATGRQPALTAADVRAVQARLVQVEELLDSARQERNKQLGENARLRQELIEKQLRMDELSKTVSTAVAQAEGRRVKPVPNSRTSDRQPAPLLVRVNEALRASGLLDLQLLEVGRLEGDQLLDLLVRTEDRLAGTSDIQPMASAQLSVKDGLVSLVFTPVAGADDAEPEPVVYVLTVWDPDAWSAVGVPVPSGFVPVNVVMDGLRQLFTYHPYELVSLSGFQGGELRDVVVRHVTSDGEVLRTFTAPRGVVLAEGPVLVLQDGVVTEGGIDRPFWHGQSRLPLPGSSYAAWVEVTGGPGG